MDSFELAERLATRPTKSSADVSYQSRLEGIVLFLAGLRELAENGRNGRIAAAWALEWVKENSDVNELRQWKEEALPILEKYDEIAAMVGGELGSSKMDNLEKFVRSKLNRGIRRKDGKIV